MKLVDFLLTCEHIPFLGWAIWWISRFLPLCYLDAYCYICRKTWKEMLDEYFEERAKEGGDFYALILTLIPRKHMTLNTL